MNKNLIMFKSGEGVVELYDIRFSFTHCLGHIFFQESYKGDVIISLGPHAHIEYNSNFLRDIADIMDELYTNKELLDQIGAF